MRYRPTYMLLTLGLLLLTSCNHKELYSENYELSQIHVDFDFSLVTEQPKAMRIFFYPIYEDGSTGIPLKYDLTAQGGNIPIPEGDYRVLAYNIDAENVLEYDEESYNGFNLTTESSQIVVTNYDNNEGKKVPRRRIFGSDLPIGDNEPAEYLIYDSPNWTCCCRLERFHVEPIYISKSGEIEVPDSRISSLTLTAEEAVKSLEFELSGIEGAKWASLIRGTISGVSGSMSVANMQPVGELGVVTFAGDVDVERNVIHGICYVWGYFPSDNTDARQFLDIYIWANSGNYYVSQDVTEQMRQADSSNSKTLLINLNSDINLMDGSEGDSGFQPSLGEWDEQNTDVRL